MRLNIPLTYPDGPNSAPVCVSADVIAACDAKRQLAGFLDFDSSARRKGLVGSRGGAAGAAPLHLYKYRSLDGKSSESIDRARSLLVHDRVWVAAPSSLNDPKDMQFKLVLNRNPETRRRWVKENDHLLPKVPPARRLLRQQQLARAEMTLEMEQGFKQDLVQGMGVFCASTDPRSRLLWAHYGAEHRGICIQLALYEDEISLFANPVIYNDEFPTLTVPTPSGIPQDYHLRKHTDWAYEKEWRVVLPLQNCSISLRPLAISAVILGARIGAAEVDAILGLQKERQHLGKPPFKVYQAMLAGDSFNIRIAGCRAPNRTKGADPCHERDKD